MSTMTALDRKKLTETHKLLDRLALLGVPWLQSGMQKTKLIAGTKSLQMLIGLLLEDSSTLRFIKKNERLKVALEAFFWALESHFPSTYNLISHKSKKLKKWRIKKIEGKHIKLKRIAVTNLCIYL